MHTSARCHLRSTGRFSQIREEFSYSEMGRGTGGSSRPSSPPGTQSALSCAHPTRGAKSHGEGLSLGSHMDPLPPAAAAAPPEAWHPSRQSYQVPYTLPYYPEGTLSAAKYKGRYTPLWTNTAEQHWVASMFSFCSFQKFPFSVVLAFSPLCTILSKPQLLTFKIIND